MDDKNQHIDQYFREQLGGYTELPTPDVWASLEQRLDEKPRKKRVIWVWFVLLFLAATGGTVSFRHFTKNASTPASPAATPTTIIPVNTTTRTDKQTPPAKPNTQPIQQPSQAPTASAPLPAKTKQPLKATTRQQPVKTTAPIAEKRNTDEPVAAIQEPKQDIITTAKTEAPQTPAQPKETPVSKTETTLAKQNADIQHLLPTAGKNKPAAPTQKKLDETDFQALTPMAGKKQAANTIPVVAKRITQENPASTQARAVDEPARTELVPASKPVDATPPAATKTATPAPVAQPSTPATTKETPPAQETATARTETAPKPKINRFAAGIKAGYEFGTKPYNANSYVVSPYVQYLLGKKWGLMLQPSVKYSHIQSALISYGSYTQTTDSLKESLAPIIPNSGRIPTGGMDEKMAYKKTYDSIVIKNELRESRFWNFDLPLLFTYKLNKNIQLYGGPTIHFTGTPTVVTVKQTFSGLSKSDTVVLERNVRTFAFDTLTLDKVFPQKGFDISAYNANAFNNPVTNPFKMGVSFGVSYTFRQRFTFDLLYRQTLSKMPDVANDKVREILRQPYIRVMLGYKFTK